MRKEDKVDGGPKTRRLQLHQSQEIGVKVGQRKTLQYTEATKSEQSLINVPPINGWSMTIGHVLRLNRADSRVDIAPISGNKTKSKFCPNFRIEPKLQSGKRE